MIFAKKTPKTPLNRKVLIPVYTFFFGVKNRAMSKHPILLFTKTLKSTPKLEKYFFLKNINYKFCETCILNKQKYSINNFTTLGCEILAWRKIIIIAIEILAWMKIIIIAIDILTWKKLIISSI